jgi:hypothetical protein
VQVEIYFANPLRTDPSVTIPAGTYTFRIGDVWVGAQELSTPTFVALADGCLIEDVYVFTGSLVIRGETTGPAQFDWPSQRALGAFSIVGFLRGAALDNAGTAPMIQWSDDVGIGLGLVLALEFAGRLDASSSVPVLDVTPGGAYAALAVVVAGTQSEIAAGAISGADGGGVALVNVRIVSTSAAISTDQPGWTGATPFSSPAVVQNIIPSREAFSVSDVILDGSAPNPYGLPYPTPGGGGGVPPGEFVRCAPDGSLTQIDLTLPLASLVPGAIFTVKRINADSATVIRVTASGADLIDGAATNDIPLLSYAYRKYVSDGTRWMVEGSGV